NVYSLTVYDNKLIAGGNFTLAGGSSADHIAAWDGASWSSLGSGVDNSPRGYTVYNNDLIVGGEFTTAGGISANYVAVWDGASWSTLGTGMNSVVRSFNYYDGKLIAGGDFTQADGNSANYVAAWDGADWTSLSLDMDDRIFSLGLYNGNLVAGGNFIDAGSSSTNYLALWNGEDWFPLGSGVNLGVRATTIYQNKLIVGGYFLTAGGKTAIRIAQWDKPARIAVTNTDNDGDGSLRWAIDNPNYNPDPDTIEFYVSGEIQLITPLSSITDDGLVFLGSSAPGGAHSVILDGSGLSKSLNSGLVIQGSNCTVEGLTITGFPGNGIEVTGGSAIENSITNNLIYGNGLLGID
ncbi:MAG: hypothetical protein GY869_29770, partial [Planctomycetes bacterium]|nr:hypothetical protein [Planctomycetota bacterium]